MYLNSNTYNKSNSMDYRYYYLNYYVPFRKHYVALCVLYA